MKSIEIQIALSEEKAKELFGSTSNQVISVSHGIISKLLRETVDLGMHPDVQVYTTVNTVDPEEVGE